ncbi:arsenate reductase (glutaredoxin) [Hydrocarboniclastica marina]|uniref:Arsenate reductase n=1 Tax=Hydrocarboniclastica marina TaxID=2259620 RepID=A0A4P7XH93_9ALTE|nr:arsenate reductase (glutaredoxin) [Hydrocarboniclastica marina]MAL98892.1 arsenate reductase (glutaredoxin) [Alteromonadaceae bacterium]QCF26386.1 arsenate reductase (glutaredoxin) [Hydrocarboniclastica marina]|tara:strand:- start:1400 stop:1759 length:360 start_codon:yes stop_codon:yes gene_type:complete
MPSDITLYHNPRCSKSRQALALLEERNVQPTVVRYLETPPTVEELRSLLGQLNLTPRDIMRKKEEPYKTLGLDDADLDDNALLQAMHNHPILIERPIAHGNGKAAVGRPPENVLKVLDQ